MGNAYKGHTFKHLDFIVLDLIIVEISLMIASLIRHGDALLIFSTYRLVNIFVVFSFLVVAFMGENYSGILRRGWYKEFVSVFIVNMVSLLLVVSVLFVMKESASYSRILVCVHFAIATVLMVLVRMGHKHMLRKSHKIHEIDHKMLVITNKEYAESALQSLKNMSFGQYQIIGVAVLNDTMQGKKIAGIDVVADRTTMFDFAKKNVIDTVYIKANGLEAAELAEKFIEMGVEVKVSLDQIITRLATLPNMRVEHLKENNKEAANETNTFAVLTSSITKMTFKQSVLKRALDIVGAIVGLIICGILLIIFGPIIYLQSPGPIIFKQTRIGVNGREFTLYKLRSMYMDAEERKKDLMSQNQMQGLMFKMDNDPRIIPIGHFIRKASIDEFPQFFNVLKGDMSLVGTRPPTKDEYIKYELHHASRLAMKPGITGMWQVSGRSDITDFEEVVRLDNEYIKNFSLGLDVKILVMTVLQVINRKGSK